MVSGKLENWLLVLQNTPELVSEVGFVQPMANGNMRLGKRKEERVRDEEPLIPGHVVTHVIEQQLCCDQLLKVKLPRLFRDGFNS